jgi:TonB family protein
VDFPYPAYLQGIANAIEAGFPAQTGSLVATVQFTINRDGSVHDIKLVSRSGDYLFDKAAEAAVDHAGSTKALGPLPADFHDDALMVVFTFSPPKPPSL